MTIEVQQLKLVWDGININITYKPDYSEVTKRIFKYSLAHLELQTENKEPLPITESGYRSHFTNAAEIEAFDTPVDFVKTWLNEKSKSKAWQKHKKKQVQEKQLKLF